MAEAEAEAEAEATFGKFRRAYRAHEFSIDEDDESRHHESEGDSEERSQFYLSDHLPFSSTTSFWMFLGLAVLAFVAFVAVWLAISCRHGEES